jgi:PAS domain-containing protein
MSQTPASANEPVSPGEHAAAALRTLATSFGHLSDFQAFFERLRRGVGHLPLGEGLRLELAPEPAPNAAGGGFRRGELAIPVVGRSELHGVLRVARVQGHRRFAPEDLHLLTSLSVYLAAWADHALHFGDILANAELLRFTLDRSPVGLLAFDHEERLRVVNEPARALLGDVSKLDLPKLFPALRGPADTPWRQHLRLAGKLVYAEGVSAPAARGRPPARVVALVDLTPEQTRLIDALGRELYRAHWLGHPLVFALVTSGDGRPDVLAHLPDVRANLPDGAIAGPYDAARLALILPEADLAVARRWMRRLRPLIGGDGARVRMVPVERSMRDVEAVLSAALDEGEPLGVLARPSLLLHDDYPAVNDMLELVLRRDFEVVKSSRLAYTRALLTARSFDGLVTELDLQEGMSGLDLARAACEEQPGLRPFFTANAASARRFEDDPLLRQAIVFDKPFAVQAVCESLRRAFAGAEV